MKKLAALLLSLLLMTAAMAEIEWPAALTSGQAALRHYVDTVNLTLTQQSGGTIDMLYELYPAFASLGVNGEETPDTVELQFRLGDGGLHSLTLRSWDADTFQNLAAACLTASSSAVSLDSANTLVKGYADVLRGDMSSAQNDPSNAMTHSFEEPVSDLQSDQPRAYFAYYPNQYGDGRHWLQLTLIFARPGSANGNLAAAGATPPPPSTDEEYEGYFSHDNYSHFEIFASPTPEPDSAAMEP